MYSTTTGTGTLTLTTAVRGFNTFALAGVVNTEIVTYTIRDGDNTEVGRGTYTTSGLTLSRDTVLSSTNAGSKISCTGRQIVGITLAAEDVQPFASYYDNATDSVANTVTANLGLDTEWIDQTDMATLAANAVTLTKKGWYVFWVSVQITSVTAFNGRVLVSLEGFEKLEGYTTAMGILTDTIYLGPIMYQAAADSDVIGPVSITNNVGSTVDAVVQELSFLKTGNV